MIIKRRISFDFLGEDYTEAYGIFSAIPISEYPQINKTVDAENNSIKKSQLMLKILREKMIIVKMPNENGELEDVPAKDFDPDGELLLTVYNRLMGGPDPKASKLSETS